jgi:hypothetical protein
VAEPAGLQEALAAVHGSNRNPGAAAELLTKLLHMLAEVQVGAAVALGCWVVVQAGAGHYAGAGELGLL